MRRLASTLLVTSLLATMLAACGASDPRGGVFESADPTAPGGSGGGGGGFTDDGSKTPTPDDPSECQKMDILFVVDDSGSMSEEQANLAKNFPKFVSTLDNYMTKSGAKLDWRIAVTTTGRDVKYTVQIPGSATGFPFDEKGDNGAFRSGGKCGGAKPWVDRDDPDAVSTFTCRAQVGTGGPGFEMPLLTTKLALDDRMKDGTNAGFLRDDALLAIVIITDEDDCSREDDNFTVAVADGACTGGNVRPVGIFTQAFDFAAKGPGRWAAAVIAGETNCSSGFGDAVEAKRLKELVTLAGKNGAFSSICDGDLTLGLQKALATFDAACKSFPGVR